MAEYDIIIIGAGPAGLIAGLYAARAGMKVKILEKARPGGQPLMYETIEDFPGFPGGIKSEELINQFKVQVLKAGLEIVEEEVKQIVFLQPSETLSWYTVKTQNKDYTTHCVILACGASPKLLGVPREEMFTGRGVSYSAFSDGALFREKEIVLVGQDNRAAKEALYLSKVVANITFIHRLAKLDADKPLKDRLKADPKIRLIANSVVVDILGEEKVTGVKIEDINAGKKRELPCEGIFIFADLKANTSFLKGFVKMDSQGFIAANKNFEASRKGIFACGDCRLRSLRQVLTACSEGAEAALACCEYIEQLKGIA